MVLSVFMNTHLAQRLRSERLKQHLSVRELAHRSDVAIGTIRRIEAGEGQAFDHTLAKLASALNLPIDAFEEVAS